jgi:hypothetical protein
MNPSRCSHDILQLIAEQIDDSITWCRFSQVNKQCYQICKRLLKHEIHENKYWYAQEFRIMLPCGLLHGEVRGEKRVNTHKCGGWDMTPPIYRYEWWYTKMYRSGKLHGYYTVGSSMAEFKDGVQIERETVDKYTTTIPVGRFAKDFWKNTEVVLPEKVSFQEFERLTLI